jgi:hypothetical protein
MKPLALLALTPAFLLITASLLTQGTLAQTSTPADAAPGPNQAPSIPTVHESERKAKALLDQMIEALGGQAYLNIQDISQEGRGYTFHLGNPNSAGTVFWRFYKFPDKDRVELTKQRDVVEIYNGDKGSELTYKGTQAAEEKELTAYLRRRHYSLDWIIRKWLPEPGIALFYEGSTVADQKAVEQVTIMNAHNEAVTLSIDSLTHLPVKKAFTWRDPTDKQRNVEEEVWDNYRLVQGLMTPFSVTRYYNGDMSNQRFLTAVSYNKGLDDSLFDPRVRQPAPRK